VDHYAQPVRGEPLDDDPADTTGTAGDYRNSGAWITRHGHTSFRGEVPGAGAVHHHQARHGGLIAVRR
jgi:hypothetical protein